MWGRSLVMWLLSCQVKLAVSQWLFLWFAAGDELLCDVGQVPGGVTCSVR